MVAEEESLREKGRAAPSPTTQALLRHTWEHREALNKVGHAEAGSVQAPCLLPVHIHSSPAPKPHSQLHAGVAWELLRTLLVPRKSHCLPGEKPHSKTPPGRPAKCSKSLLIPGN